MGDQDVITEVPAALKRLAKYMVRGFYGVEYALVLDVLIRYPCVKEDDLLLLLKYERKQLRTVLNTLKADKFVKLRMRVETGPNGKSTRHNYYYINYKVLVDVVKYKLDHVRRKIEADERDSTTRSSFKCPSCFSTYTDLEVNQLFDIFTETFRCTYCNAEVEEDASALPKRDARTLLAKFNEQIEPIFALLRETEDVVLPHDLLEPQPTEIPELSESFEQKVCSSILDSSTHPEKWANKNSSVGNMYVQNLVIDVQDSEPKKKGKEKVTKEHPIWMTHSTVQGASSYAADSNIETSKETDDSVKEAVPDNEVIRTLLIHESKSSSGTAHPPPLAKNKLLESESDTSESEEEAKHAKPAVVKAAGSDLEQEEQETLDPTVMVAGKAHLYSEVSDNPELVSLMTDEEREIYIKVGQEMFQSVFE
ncbi:general transcription factor IIE subunit 1-like [Chelonoidis abingdonii]|uniref:general transcription factor IIE subunit 1-like n=1 Tax=Chelonoidis abingdonii TaxID=106734 RepID=UPI0013F243D9|nr:general transcription factor IIE subunit 1-like isoform X1 [Chelonoidis abingdonii]XP_032654097.1 general transcription factor IIE subunit 1-like isoform X1 [Chelonoidis abingdonii]